jgi:hypothetical protein
MSRITRYSLHASLALLRDACVASLAEEYPDQRIEMRAIPQSGSGPLYHFWVDGRPFGEPVNLENLLGRALRAGHDDAVRSITAPLSEQLMMYLQTAA